MAADDEQPPIEIPHDVVNEQILLAAALSDDDLREQLVGKISPDLFVEQRHAAAWAALRELRRRRLVFDVAALHGLCSDDVELGYLRELATSYPGPPQNVSEHVAALRWDRVRVDAVNGPLAELIKSLGDPRTPPERVRALGRAVGSSLDVATDRRFMRDATEVARAADAQIKERARRGVFPFELPGLDSKGGEHRMLPGAAPRMVTVVTGVSGGGKSVLCAHVALAQARAERKVLYGAWEMGDEETLGMLAIMSLRNTAETEPERDRWTRARLTIGDYGEAERRQLRERMEIIGERIRFFGLPARADRSKADGKGDWRRERNRRALDALHQQVADSGCEVVVLDLWKRMFAAFRSEEDEQEALIETQDIAKETHTHMILAQQQKLKEVEQRDDKRPTREAIKGSSAWVDVADTILGAHRRGQWSSNITDDTMEIIVLKQRYGPWPFAVEFDWDPRAGQISGGRDVEYKHEGRGRARRDEFAGLGRS